MLTSLYTFPAGFGAFAAVIMIVRPALLGTPLASLGTETADLVRKPTVSRARLGAQQTQVNALTTTMRTIIVALHIDHRMQTTLTSGGALQTGFDTFFTGRHGSSPKVG
nr:hypothetical protein [Roseimaritima ulvae]